MMPVELHHGDCMDVLSAMPDNSIDSVVTDPPYGISFMGRVWDHLVPSVALWKEVIRVLKPGGHMLSFGGTRTYHRMVVNIEDAGFEIRDQIGYCFGTGFPKSHNLTGEWQGWGTALKPAWEPICVARKPLTGTVAQNVLRHGVGGLNIDACRVETDDDLGRVNNSTATWGTYGSGPNRAASEGITGRWPANLLHDGSEEVMEAFAAFGEKTSGKLAAHHVRHTDKQHAVYGSFKGCDSAGNGKEFGGDTGSAARFFYCAKASKKDRCDSKHPTVKPVALMQWLCRLVTPPGGTVLDPFAGSGTTGQAAVMEGFNAILIEKEAEYCADIRRRLGLGDFQLTAAAD